MTSPLNAKKPARPQSVAPEALPILGCNAVTDKSAPQGLANEPRLYIDQRMNPTLPKNLGI